MRVHDSNGYNKHVVAVVLGCAFVSVPDGNMTQYGDLAFFWDAGNRFVHWE